MTTALWHQSKSSASRRVPIVASGIWAIVLGITSGSACMAVKTLFGSLQWIFVQHAGSLPEAAASLAPVRRVLTPVLGAACATGVIWGVRRWSRSGKRVDEYVEAVRCRGGQIAFAQTSWRTLSSAFSIATGAAIGREGSMIQFAAAVTSWIGKRSPIQAIPLSRQVAYGVAAAVAAVYRAPLAGIFFATEIVLGECKWEEMPRLALAAGSGWLVSRIVLGAGPLFPVHEQLVFSHEILWALPLAMLLGLAAPVYHQVLRSLRCGRFLPFALVWGACVVGLLSIFQPAVWGNGDVALSETLKAAPGANQFGYLLLLRLVATTCCVGVGTKGGVFTPTAFAGAAMGILAGAMIHPSQPILFAIVGLGAFLSAVTHAPWMSAFMAVELTGQWRLLPVLLAANLISWMVARRISSHSLYAIATPEPTDETIPISTVPLAKSA